MLFKFVSVEMWVYVCTAAISVQTGYNTDPSASPGLDSHPDLLEERSHCSVSVMFREIPGCVAVLRPDTRANIKRTDDHLSTRAFLTQAAPRLPHSRSYTRGPMPPPEPGLCP